MRIGFFVIAYAFHSNYGLAHLTWILLSWIFPLKYVIPVTTFLVFPAVLIEFVIKYFYSFTNELPQSRISNNIFTDYFYYSDNPMSELALLFFLVLVASMMFKANSTYTKEVDQVKEVLFRKAQNSSTSIGWKFLFLGLKSLHYGTLLILFIIGVSEINLYHLGFMFFFIIYVAS